MTSRDFVYFLQGMFELTDVKKLDEKQTELIKRHLALVFKHEIDPSMGNNKHQKELNDIHSPPTKTDQTEWPPQSPNYGDERIRC